MSASAERVRIAAELAAVNLLAAQGKTLRPTRRQLIDLEASWPKWITTLFPAYVSTFASHHIALWNWIWSIERNVKPKPFVAIWSRGGGKSTNAEIAAVSVGARGVRDYVLYVSATQAQADDHVQNIASMLESKEIEYWYPELANRRLGKYGTSRGWRRNRLRTASGLTIDAVGMDTAARGLKLEEDRPDMIIVDDIDEEGDTRETTLKKVRRLTHAILPAGSDDAAELFIQNLILPEGIFARLAGLASEQADFLHGRTVSGPHPAIRDMTYEVIDHVPIITGGDPTWADMDIDRCQELLNTIGLAAFLSECQHEVGMSGQRVFYRSWWDSDNRYDASQTSALNASTAARFIHWDTAISESDDAAYTAAIVFDLTSDYRLRLRHVFRERLNFPDLVSNIMRLADEWNTDGKLREVTIEDKSSGSSAVQTLKAHADPLLAKRIVAWMPTGSKEYRARQTSVWCKTGFIELPLPSADVPWLADFESELYAFPLSLFADQVDAFVQGILYLEPWLRVAMRRMRAQMTRRVA
jgi:predicted phage terminase large subunit-like protein